MPFSWHRGPASIRDLSLAHPNPPKTCPRRGIDGIAPRRSTINVQCSTKHPVCCLSKSESSRQRPLCAYASERKREHADDSDVRDPLSASDVRLAHGRGIGIGIGAGIRPRAGLRLRGPWLPPTVHQHAHAACVRPRPTRDRHIPRRRGPD
jgi:hypothetical protein